MSIPLVQNNEKDSINTSIIAIKRNIERINMLLGLVDSGSPDLSGLATKQELENAVTEINDTIDEVETSLQPVDAVTSGNLHSVTSNAVYNAISNVVLYQGIGFRLRVNNKTVHLDVYVHITSKTIKTYILSESIPQQYCPPNDIRNVFVNNSNDTPYGQCIVGPNGNIRLFKANGGAFDEADYVVATDWILA